MSDLGASPHALQMMPGMLLQQGEYCIPHKVPAAHPIPGVHVCLERAEQLRAGQTTTSRWERQERRELRVDGRGRRCRLQCISVYCQEQVSVCSLGWSGTHSAEGWLTPVMSAAGKPRLEDGCTLGTSMGCRMRPQLKSQG